MANKLILIEKPELPIKWDYDESVEKTKMFLDNGGRGILRKITHYEKLLEGTNIYFIQAGENGPIKIGEAYNIRERLKQLQIGNHLKLYLIGEIQNVPRMVEKEIQNKFKKYHLRCEWYKPDIKNELEIVINEQNNKK